MSGHTPWREIKHKPKKRPTMAEDYPHYVTLTPKQVAKLARYLKLAEGEVVVQQAEDGRLLVTGTSSSQQWKIGVRGGWS